MHAKVKLKGIVAADYIINAMRLGYVSAKSFGLDPNYIQWVQADITSKEFINWLKSRYPSFEGKYRIVTLVQPSLKESGLVGFLKKCSQLAMDSQVNLMLVMPILIHDKTSVWFKHCNAQVEGQLELARKYNSGIQLRWAENTQYGAELQRNYNGEMVPEQYFVDIQSPPEILKATGMEDISSTFLELDPTSNSQFLEQAPGSKWRSTRVWCISSPIKSTRSQIDSV